MQLRIWAKTAEGEGSKSPEKGRLQGLCGPVDKPTRGRLLSGWIWEVSMMWWGRSHLLNDTIHVSRFGGENMLWSWMRCSITAELQCLGRECGFLILWPSRWKKTVSLPFLDIHIYRRPDGCHLPILTFVSPLALITTHPHWCSGPELCVIGAAFMVRQCFWRRLQSEWLQWQTRLNCSLVSLLSQHNIKLVGFPPRKICGFLWPVKDYLRLRAPGVHSIPCECSEVYARQKGCSI